MLEVSDVAKLTKRTVEAAPVRSTDYFIFDEDLPGFGLRITPKGVKSFMIQYRKDGRTRRVTFGRAGILNPQKARTQAMELLAAVRAGEDPAQALRDERGAPTVADLCDRFMREHVKDHCKPSTAAEYRRSVELFIKPRIGSQKVGSIDRSDVTDLHYSMKDTPYQATRTLGVLSKMFNLAEVWGLRPDGSTPCRHVKKFKETKRKRYLSEAELRALGEALDDHEPEFPSAVAALRLLILTGCRLGEILSLRWEHVELENGQLDLPDSKTGQKTIYLGTAAVAVLKAITPLADNPYVIVGGNAGDHLKDLQKPWRKIRASAGLQDVRIHDLRHTFGSAGVNDGMSLPIVGKLLGHTRPETTARYAHLADTALRLAAERISDTIGGAILNGRRNGSDWSELGAMLRAAREKAGLSLTDVARKVAVTEIDAAQIEKGCDMTLGLLQRYANALGSKVEIRLSDASS